MPFTRLRYHLTFATHDRRPLITPEVESSLYKMVCNRTQEKHRSRIVSIGGVEDHIHLLLALRPTICISKYAGDIKGASSHFLNGTFNFNTPFRWQEGYGAFTINPFQLDPVIDYIENQREHHANRTLWTEYERRNVLQID